MLMLSFLVDVINHIHISNPSCDSWTEKPKRKEGNVHIVS